VGTELSAPQSVHPTKSDSSGSCGLSASCNSSGSCGISESKGVVSVEFKCEAIASVSIFKYADSRYDGDNLSQFQLSGFHIEHSKEMFARDVVSYPTFART